MIHVNDLLEWGAVTPEKVTVTPALTRMLAAAQDVAGQATSLVDALWHIPEILIAMPLDEMFDVYFDLGFEDGDRDSVDLVSADHIYDTLEDVLYNIAKAIWAIRQPPGRPRYALVHVGTKTVFPNFSELLVVDMNAVTDPFTDDVDWDAVDIAGAPFTFTPPSPAPLAPTTKE